MIASTGVSVLYVDDDSTLGDLTADILSKRESNFTVETAANASEGLDRLATDGFDCVVSDYDMPGQNGIEFLKTVREEYPDLPFILYTGKGSEAVASDAIAAGVTDYLQKESGTSQYTILANQIRNAVERHRQQERAQATRDRLRQIIDKLPQLVFAKNEAGEFLLVNEATADAYGTTVGNLEGATDADFADSEKEVEQFHADDQAVIESGKPKHIPEEALTTADGETRLLETTKIPYDPIETDSDAVLGISTDITERKEREAELKIQSAAMEAAMDGISILNEDHEYIYMNQAHADIFGYDADELLGSTWRRLYGDDEGTRIEQEAFPVLEDEGEWRGETVGKRRDGTDVYQEITLSSLDDGGLICTNRDITERKEREQKLTQTNTVLRTIVENLPMGVLVEDAERDVLMANDLLGETLGMPIDSDQLVGRDCAEAAEELKNLFADPERFIQEIGDRIERQEPVQNEELSLADGRVVERDYVPYTLPEGEAILWLYRDVTERKQRQKELERSSQFLRDTQEVAAVGGWEFDLRSESLRWSDEVYHIHGVSRETDVTFEDAIEAYHPEDRDTIQGAFDRLTTNGEPYELEVRVVTADGDVRWVSALGEPEYEDGETVAVQGTFQDITERIERQQQLEQQTAGLEQLAEKYESQYRTLFEEAPVMTVLTRSEGGRPVIGDYNSQFVETLGYDSDTVIGRELTEFYTSESAEKLESGGYSRSINGEFTREKRDLLTTDGEVIETLLRSVPRRTADGEIIGTVAMYIDISERESVKRTNRRLEEFTGVVSHDLRNPLQVATGGLELASMECDSDYLDDVKQGLNRMDALIDDLLMLAREGKEVTNAQPVDLATMIDGCWETVETGQAAMIDDTNRSIRADRSRLKQVFENLFRNAVEHGGTAVNVAVGELDDGFYVEDDGPGIPPDDREDIFEAGYSQSTDGTGFGLSIVEQIVTAHDWQIRVTDGGDGGARFEITDVEFITD